MNIKGIAIVNVREFCYIVYHKSKRKPNEAVVGDSRFKIDRAKRLVNAEFAAISLAHNIRKMIAKGIAYALKWR